MPGVRAGLECRVDDPDAPTVVKDMTLGFRMRQILEAGECRLLTSSSRPGGSRSQ